MVLTRKIATFVLIGWVLSVSSAFAALTPAQKATLKAAILADPALNAFPNTDDGNFDLAVALRAPASPNFTVWKTSVSLMAIGNNFVASEITGMTSINLQRLQVLAQYRPNGTDPSILDNRQSYDDVFSGAGGSGTRARLLILWKRLANKLERIFAVGTGSDAVPATMTLEGSISGQDVADARNSQ